MPRPKKWENTSTDSLNRMLDEVELELAEAKQASDTNLIRRLNYRKETLKQELGGREEVVVATGTIPNPQDIPHVFMNVELTEPASKELASYLKIMLRQDLENLRYLYDKSQEFVEFGNRKMTFAVWHKKLKVDLERLYGNTI